MSQNLMRPEPLGLWEVVYFVTVGWDLLESEEVCAVLIQFC